MQLIYRLTSPSGKVYIGQTKRLSGRLSSYRTLKCRNQTLLYNSLRKYGFEQHTFYIVHRFPHVVSQEIVDNYERYVIQVHRFTVPEGLLNLTDGGRGNAGRAGQESKPRPDVQGEKHKLSILSEEKVLAIRSFYQRGVRGRGIRQVSRNWNISLRLAYNIVNYLTWKHLEQ